jgi:hypothetical protein
MCRVFIFTHSRCVVAGDLKILPVLVLVKHLRDLEEHSTSLGRELRVITEALGEKGLVVPAVFKVDYC